MKKKKQIVIIGVLVIAVLLFLRIFSRFLAETKYTDITLISGIILVFVVIFGMNWWIKKKK